jgi:ATP-dependent DNA helicase RecG
MRPAILFSLFADAQTLAGVGPRIEKSLAKITGVKKPRIIDLLFHPPFGFVDRNYHPMLIDAETDRIATVRVHVLKHKPAPRGRRLPYRVMVRDETAVMEIVFFRAYEDHIKRTLPEGETRVVSGRIERFNDRLQMAHPDFIVTIEDANSLPMVEPVYRTTEGLAARTLGRIVQNALEKLPELPEWQDQAYHAKKEWSSFGRSLRNLHAPDSENDFSSDAIAKTRLAYDELLANQLAQALVRKNMRARPGRALKGNKTLTHKALATLPFELTDAQEVAMSEIVADMAQSSPMLRLLQGDVGSGKTVVAMVALLTAVEAGVQGAFMAPTELLACQHIDALTPMAQAASIRLALLTGRERGQKRVALINDLKNGKIDILVGTHALFSEDVAFRDLGLVVVDEQHRFGVHQRLELQSKGEKPPDVLVMTATPIPRTLQLTAYGDMEVSRLIGKLPGRQPVTTRVLPADRVEEVVSGLRRAIAENARAYWVCPAIQESEKSDLAAVEERAAMLENILGPVVGLIHGRMKAAARDKTMESFRKGDTKILVATTVIEVGVDVPEANIMVVEHAERFGLAQLHQLRGRVGRGLEQSSCLLVYHTPIGATATERLKVLRDNDDGFVIAEKDLLLRGEGELLGVTQSGIPEFIFADITVHSELLASARDDARLILQKDPQLKSTRGEALRTLLYLFERDEAVRYLLSG